MRFFILFHPLLVVNRTEIVEHIDRRLLQPFLQIFDDQKLDILILSFLLILERIFMYVVKNIWTTFGSAIDFVNYLAFLNRI